LKSFGQAFSKACRFQGQRPWSPSAAGEILWTPEKFLFLLLFLLAKGEKEDVISGFRTGLLKKSFFPSNSR